MQESVTLRTNRVSQIGAILTANGGQATLQIFSGTLPANCAAPDPSGLMCTINLPATPLGASNGTATMLGSWSGVVTNSGLANTYRLYDAIPTCHVQGYISEPWAPSRTYTSGQNISNVNGVYDCASGGVSASSGVGPSGTGTGILDGGVLWNFIAPAAEMVLATTNLNPGTVLPVKAPILSIRRCDRKGLHW